jgi:hypothetical protein
MSDNTNIKEAYNIWAAKYDNNKTIPAILKRIH